jgi:hypothetical protein
MQRQIRRALQRDDVAVSAVIGTILMIAATVILGGVIYAAVSGFGQKDTSAKVDAVFKAQAIDTNNDGITDTIKLTYLSGPSPLNTVTYGFFAVSNSTALPNLPAHSPWNVGDFVVYGVSPGTYLVNVTAAGTDVLDSSLRVG